MDLLAARVQPGAAEAEVGTVVTGFQTQHIDVEAPGCVDIVNVDRHVVNGKRSHKASVAAGDNMDNLRLPPLKGTYGPTTNLPPMMAQGRMFGGKNES